MYTHYIIMSSAYSIGKRIALDYLIKSDKDFETIKKNIAYIEKHCKNDLHLSSHYIQVNEKGWKAVTDYDGFFKNVKVIKNIKEFVNLINDDKDLTGLDVARYILTRIPCTHLKLEKLVYLSYADYLCNTKENLFNDRIYAYKLGPVIQSVYKKYKKKKCVLNTEDDEEIKDESKLALAIRSRIMSSKNGSHKVFSIDETLKKIWIIG